MKDLIIAEIDILPPLPQSIAELQNICTYEEVTIHQVVEVIEKDPFLSADLIAYANSPLYGYVRSVSSVFQAVYMFGISTAKGLAIASAIKSTFKLDFAPYKLTTKQFINSSNLKSAFLMQWYKEEKDLHNPLIPCGLVMHIGMAVIVECLKKVGKTQSFMESFNAEKFLESETQLLSCNQLDILEYLLNHWHFDKKVIDIIRCLRDNTAIEKLEPYIYPLRVANALISPFSIATQEQIQNASVLVEKYALNAEKFEKAVRYLESLQSQMA